MAALLDASARRKAHEREVHAYEHVGPVEPEAGALRGAALRVSRTRVEVRGW
jgi:hypothetical protein